MAQASVGFANLTALDMGASEAGQHLVSLTHYLSAFIAPFR